MRGAAASAGVGVAHQRVRETTAALHRALGGQAIPAAMPRAAYVAFLTMNHACASIEPALTRAGVRRVLPDWNQRERRFALARDMAALDIEVPPVGQLVIAGDTGTLLGWSYVLEGSRRGAPFILRAVQASPDKEIRTATAFLRHGERRDFWAGFTAALARIDQYPVATTKACAAARAAFRCFAAASVTPVGGSF